MTVLSDEYRSKLQTLAQIQAEVNTWPKDDIVKLDLPDFALACRALKSQSYGALGERWLCDKLEMTRVTGNKDYDATDKAGKRYEIKFTIATEPHKKFNVVQVRPDADIDGYLIFGINSDNTANVWQMNKFWMTHECSVLKAKSAHGKFDPDSKTQELRFSFAEGDLTYHRWNKNYRLTPRGW
jgi:hypothetical protein